MYLLQHKISRYFIRIDNDSESKVVVTSSAIMSTIYSNYLEVLFLKILLLVKYKIRFKIIEI